MERTVLKLGVIGLSEGNGHPYSWSAIINGYNPIEMEHCGYPVIPRYLEEQSWPESQARGAKVVCVWTQDNELSRRVAAASLIDEVVETPEQMISRVDGLLLARDDAENHYEFASPFLRAGKPVFIDKPIALNVQSLEDIYSLEQYEGQIFTCSALRYSTELQLSEDNRSKIGKILQILAYTPKSWDKYAIHIIEPVLRILDNNDSPVKYELRPKDTDGSTLLNILWGSGIETKFYTLGAAAGNIRIHIHGEKGSVELIFSDSFSAFKAAIQDYIDGIKTSTVRSPYKFNQRVVQLIQAGRG